ncbi:DUF6445 family protein [Massilia sp. W12]|uniref:DUF6445 family protein n=1 Tax=Massilia sp. W12 TaxID=3126507 RepID=UPI0030D451B0
MIIQAEPPRLPRPPKLTYRKPVEGRDYWIKDDFLPNPQEISERMFALENWEIGFPRAKEFWPGQRSPGALLPAELEYVENWVKKVTGAKKLWQPEAGNGGKVSHNYAQLVGLIESGPRPHTDSRNLCRYAAVIYLTPDAPPEGGTSFYRLRYRDGSLGGNLCTPPHNQLAEALGTSKLPLQAWHEDLMVPNKFNRILLYRADLVHSASNYFGMAHHEKRMTALFFWMA